MTGCTRWHFQDTYWISTIMQYFFISSYPFSQLLKPGSWRHTSPFHCCFFIFTWELCWECRTSTSTQHMKLKRSGSQMPGEGLHVTHRRSNLSVPCRHRDLCTAPHFTKRCSALTSSLALWNGLACSMQVKRVYNQCYSVCKAPG